MADTFSRFYTRIERVLRRSLGVSETAQADVKIKPAPPVAPFVEEEEKEEEISQEIPEGEENQAPMFELPPELKDKVSVTMEEIDDDEWEAIQRGHDEL